ncbi:MAG TPA: GNAT family N-acetyltransferase [Sphingomonadales bacterium]
MPQHELTPIPPGKLASVVTFLEMRELAQPDPAALERDDLELRRVSRPTPAWYRELFLAVGREWLWFSRLRLDDTALTAIIHDPAVEIYALYRAGEDAPKGMLELDFRKAPDLELAFLGVTADMVGQGGGRFLLASALRRARELGPARFWLHTCNHDSPRALPLYRKAGFVPYERAVEIVDDPRLDGTLPRSAAPNIPII